MLTESKVIDQTTVDEFGNILVRERTDILRDGSVVASSFSRRSFRPGESVDIPAVAAIADTVWTPEVIAKTQEKHAAFAKSLVAVK